MRPRLHIHILIALLLAALSGCSGDSVEPPAKATRSAVVVQLTHDDEVFQANPVFSPDGNWILFEADAAGNMDIWMMPAAGGDPVQLTTDPAFDSTPFWAPDGRRFAFESERSGRKNIWIYDLDAAGDNPTPLTEGDWDDGSPCWSPDGAWVAYESNRQEGGGQEIWMSPADGGEAVRMTTGGAAIYHRTADFSPDSAQLVFESNREEDRSALYTLDVTGGDPVRITPTLGYEGHPTWSPDGSEIAYEGSGAGPIQVWVIPSVGGEPLQVTEDGGYWPRWSPDGSKIVYGVFGDGEPNLFTVEVDW